MADLDALLQEAIAKVCNVEAARVRPEVRLADLGVDSLSAAEILVEMEIQLGTDLPVDVLRRLDQADTVGDIAVQLHAALGAES